MKNTKIIKKNYEFRNIFSKGKYYSGSNIEAFIKKNKGNKSYNYMGIAVSVKVGKAVKRNHIKRLIREAYKYIEEFIIPGHSFVFLWKKKSDIVNLSYKNVKKDMIKIFSDANMYEDII